MENEVAPIEYDVIALGGEELQKELLLDQTMSRDGQKRNIFWATRDYEHLGRGYAYDDPITLYRITGEHGDLVKPRVLKAKERQTARSKDMAEVFTPSWVCNAQNNLIDEAWFGRPNVFNTELTLEDGTHTWQSTPQPVTFPEGKSWRDYILDTRLEITCGEAPYLVSRYDTTTGQPIPLSQRIGMLDRKMRIVDENTTTPDEWTDAMLQALQSTYGYEWQGDNLLLARESVFYTILDYSRHKFGQLPTPDTMLRMANVISWNLWQMDGLKGVIPGSCERNKPSREGLQLVLFDDTPTPTKPQPCLGCTKGTIHQHRGDKCVIRDWTQPEGKQELTYVSMIKP